MQRPIISTQRKSIPAMLLSAAFHGCVLVGVINFLPESGVAGLKTMDVEMVQLAPPTPEPPRPEPPQPEPPKPEPPQAEPPKPAPADRPKPAPTVKKTAPATPPPSTNAGPVMSEPAPTAPTNAAPTDSQAESAPPSPPPPAANPASGGDAQWSLKDYGTTLWKRIIEYRPRSGFLPGTAMITFRLDIHGQLLDVRVSSSSGSDRLDEAALAAVRSAAPFPPPPPQAIPSQLVFTIPFSAAAKRF